MKKNRPGILLTVLCGASDLANIEATILQNSTTLGLRKWSAERTVLPRTVHRVTTSWGDVAGIVAVRPGKQMSFAPEYEDCRRIAEESNVALIEIYRAAQQAFDPQTVEPFSQNTENNR